MIICGHWVMPILLLCKPMLCLLNECNVFKIDYVVLFHIFCIVYQIGMLAGLLLQSLHTITQQNFSLL